VDNGHVSISATAELFTYLQIERLGSRHEYEDSSCNEWLYLLLHSDFVYADFATVYEEFIICLRSHYMCFFENAECQCH